MKSIVASLILLLVSCSTPAVKHKELRLAFQTMPATCDPRKSGDFSSSTLICLLYEGLTRCDANGGVEPALAKKIDCSEDGCIYTFHLRKSLWSDGHAVTASDFEESWKKILDPSFPSLCSYLLFPIKHGEKCAQGELPLNMLGIRALDERTLEVELERPTPHFLSLTAFPLLLPVPSHVSEPSFEGLVCNGPFRIGSFAPNREIYLEKNPTFWNRQQILLDAIRIHIIGDETTMLQLFERGELDWLGAPLAPIPPDALLSLQNKVRPIPMAASTFIAFNTQTGPFRNEHLRQAFSLSIDRDLLVGELALIGQIPAKRALPPSLSLSDRGVSYTRVGQKLGIWGVQKDRDERDNERSNLDPSDASKIPSFGPTLVYDPDAALLHLKQALEELGISSFSTTLYYKMGQTEKLLAQALQRKWKETLGVMIQIEQIDPKSHMEKLHLRGFEIAIASWIAQFHDPINLLERYRLSTNPKNFAGWENKEYGKKLEAASLETDERKRLEWLASAEDIFLDKLPIAPLYHWAAPSIAQPRVNNIASTPSGGILFEKFWVNESQSSDGHH